MKEIARTYKGLLPLRVVRYEDTEIFSGCPYSVEYNPNNKPDSDNAEDFEKEWLTMGGSVGFNDSTFKTLAEAVKFLFDGLAGEEENREIWLDMLVVK